MTIGEARLESILGGRFLREENSGMSAGRPVERLKIWGYDNAKQQYVSVWMYTMETGVLMLTGTSPDGGKTLEFTAELPQPAGPGVQMLYVTVRDAEHAVS